MQRNGVGLYLLLVLLPLQIFSQLSVTPSSSASTLAQTITGSGITVTNASLNCGANASGTFSYSGSNLGMTGGIILTTGMATDPANPGSHLCSVSNFHNFQDPDLQTIDVADSGDACILEFDFVPICNSLNITFVFGSEEYPTYIGSYNDGFGIFLTGPNPSSGNYTSQNIAVLPGISPVTPVSINNVNNGNFSNPPSHPSFFHDNYTTPNNDIGYDGYTIPITSTTPVVPCSTYHMKIGIADASDEILDSGVLIGSNAVSCTTAPVITASTNPANCGGSNGSATVTITSYTGTATYQWSPGGQTTASISNLAAGTYSCVVTYTAACGTISQTVTATIPNVGAVIVVSPTITDATCSSSTNGSVSIALSGGTSPYTATWNTSPVQTGTTAVNLAPGTYQVNVSDFSGCVQSKTVTIGVINPTVLQVSNFQVCGTHSVLTSPSGSNYQWYDNTNTVITGATSQTYSATGLSNGQHYTVTYADPSTGCKDSTRIQISEFYISFSAIPSAPCNGGNNGSLTFSSAPGTPFTSFDWLINGPTSNAGAGAASPININNLAAGNYTVMISQAGNSSCAFTYTTNLVANSIPAPVVDTIRVCNGDTVVLNPGVAGSTHHWYSSASILLSVADSLVLFPPPYSGPNSSNGASYYDTLQNATGCKSVYKAIIKFRSFNSSLSIEFKPRCHNDATGKIKVGAIRENNGPLNQVYTFDWIYPSPYTSPPTITGGSTVPVYSTESNLNPGFYQCIIKAGNCIDTVSTTLVNPPLLPNDTMHAYFCPKDSLALIVAPSGHSPYHWLNNNVLVTSSQNSNYANDSIYVLTSEIANYSVYYTKSGCPDSAKIRVDVPSYNAFHPDATVNIFTPNGDNRNDLFYPFYTPNVSQYHIAKQAESYSLVVYNRWGKLVFETSDYAKGWDGKEANGAAADDGSYFYIAKYKSNCGTKADIVQKKGFVTLLR